MVNLSKSKYCTLWQCPKMAWLKKYKPELATVDPSVESRMVEGNEVGDLAMGLFGSYVEVTAYDGDKLDLNKMVENTKEELLKGTDNICEASFVYNGLYCAVDILRKEKDGYAIYEVKSSTQDEDHSKDDKPVYIADISYQKYVLDHSGINVTGTYLVNVNRDYIFDGTLKLDEFFIVTNVWNEVLVEERNVEPNLKIADEILTKNTEPDIDLSINCNKPYTCGFFKYCKEEKNILDPSIFDLYGKALRFSTKIKLYNKGVITYEQALKEKSIKNEIVKRQMEYYLNDLGTYVDKKGIKSFLDALSYPIYFLDFETMKSIIPKYIGTKPNQQIPFQYSLHYIESIDGELKHKEFLAESGPDPRRSIAESLCENIPMDVCVLAYYKGFECGRLRELAETFPDLSEHLLNIENNVIDLLIPFQKGFYYNKLMGGTFSIKSVLPAIFPDDPALDYHNLEGVHNGGEAMTIFPKIEFMDEEEKNVVRANLLKYCELDTYAMVKVWKELVRVSK